MSTELKPTANFSLTRFSGGRRGVCIQLTQLNSGETTDAVGYIQLSKQDAKEMAIALMEFAMDDRKGKYEDY